ncbi:hypothetical protein ASE08_07520 [Rhizobacter sp. Root16D2]|nr:hypothetical protein ASC88_24785 [Rhizobacter sp. Root29]KQW06837.1 hypothetical protein ASC98_25675 [Rhizobacter sp. Root1238]KRB19041.1 hypothetical protein ASE08_07520 [Rhizobacter sp. Root16D2]
MLAATGLPADAQERPQPASTPAQTRVGVGQPVAVVAANSDEAVVRVVLRDTDGEPSNEDLSTGLLVAAGQPGLVVRPGVVLLDKERVTATKGDFAVTLRVTGLFAFGESSASLLYKGRQVEVLRFSKVGLALKAANPPPYIAHEDHALMLSLENPSGFEYRTVRVRLRVADKDACRLEADAFPGLVPQGAAQAPSPAPGASSAPHPESAALSAAGDDPCKSHLAWNAFSVPRYAAMTLRVQPPAEWFVDPATGYLRSAKRNGLLTLRFEGGTGGLIHEQNLPIEVQFEPSPWSLSKTLARVGALLLAGAVLSLFLHVSVPNIKRKNLLKDQLTEAAKLTTTISSEVDSTLRVLLRVERLALDELRQSEWPISPSYAQCARRVEQALPTLKRRIDAVRRLDATLIRLKLATTQNPAPTRIEQIESYIASVSEVLKQDSLSEEEWVFLNQRLEAAQKLLREPTQAEKEAFEALLSGRWKAIKAHFQIDEPGKFHLSSNLTQRMSACVPDARLLPNADDLDGIKWIREVGPTRADLQLYALNLLWEFEFLLPTQAKDHWQKEQGELADLLATPVLDNLRKAKSLLRELAENVSEETVVEALQTGMADIAMDPAIPRPNQRIRFSVRFRDARLNTAAARGQVTCHWTFCDRRRWSLGRAMSRQLHRFGGWMVGMEAPVPEKPLGEQGWSVHHYVERDIKRSDISVRFSKASGKFIDLSPAAPPAGPVWHTQSEPVYRSRRSREGSQRFWIEMLQIGAALLVPLATLASQTVSEGSTGGSWWQLVVIGFASDTIKSILVGRQDPPAGSTP